MAQRVHILLEDDLDGGEAIETVQFGLDGTNYEMDLSEKNAAKLRQGLKQFIVCARRTKVSGRGRSRGARVQIGPDSQTVRKWADSNGYEVSSRGRVPQEIQEAFAAANQS